MNSKLKIAIYAGSYPDTTFITLLARKLAKRNFEIHIYGRLKLKNKEDTNINFFTYASKSKISIFWFLLKYIVRNLLCNYKNLVVFSRIIKNDSLYQKYSKALIILPILYHKPDIIHLQWIKSYQLFSPFISIINAKLIVSIRGHQLSVSSFIYPHFKKNTIDATNKAFRIHSISDDLSNQLLAINPNIKNKIVKINPAIDLDLFSIDESNIIRKKHEPLKLISVCRLSWIKGLVDAIGALKLVSENGIDFQYQIIGDGEQMEELCYMIKDLGLSNKIKLLGKMPQIEVKEYLSNADVFLMPSIEEGFSNAVIEAQALGLPCLVSDAGGLEENIENGKTGFVFKKRDSKSLAIMIEKFDRMSELEYCEMRRNAVIHCHLRYDVDKQIEKFENLYLDV